MEAIISPSTLKGTILAPASKSSMQRACAAALISRKKTYILNPGHSNDDQVAQSVLKALNCKLETGKNLLIVDSTENSLTNNSIGSPLTVQCGESGLGIRMFAPLLALSSRKIHIQGSGSLLSRPMDFFDEILPVLEVRISSNKGKLPISIEGPLVPKNIEIDGSLSSQFLTGLLFAYSASGAENVSINVKNLKSAPYIDLTLKVLEEFGLALPENKNYQEFRFGKQNPDLKKTNPIQYTVEADWSGSAFLLVAGAIAGNIEVEGLDPQSTQADKKILKALHDAGADLKISNQSIRIQTSELEAFQFDATDCPDLFPPLVALASYCSGNSLIRGVTRLAHKESNRGLTLQEEFGKLGVKIELSDDLMIVHGGLGVDGGQVHSRHDHRIAMACAVAALKVKAGSEVRIEDAEAINKSYPDFYEHLKLLGAGIRDQQIKTLY